MLLFHPRYDKGQNMIYRPYMIHDEKKTIHIKKCGLVGYSTRVKSVLTRAYFLLIYFLQPTRSYTDLCHGVWVSQCLKKNHWWHEWSPRSIQGRSNRKLPYLECGYKTNKPLKEETLICELVETTDHPPLLNTDCLKPLALFKPGFN